ncbi:MAG: hypothetical protein N3C58_03535 [Meiothermus ruber]|jgi:hypothetical protein|uniref:Uncharacterized protein n=1 Tax=Meiothermus ruber TaxID=277 RepID=A0A7C3DPH9_MEIRU|nr:hypothetical protein [Meiothermus ruber]
MRMLAEAIYELEPGQMLVGQTPTARELLKLWIHRHHTGFDLYAVSIVEAGEPLPEKLRNTVGRDMASCAEVFEALHCIEDCYSIAPHVLKNLPVTVREATPELLELLEEQMFRVAKSTETGEFGPDDPPAQIVRLKPVCALEEHESDEDFAGLVLTDP